MMLTLEPNLVRMEDLKNNISWMEELATKHRRLGKDRAVSLYWMASDLNESGAVGDATLASSEKGEVLVEYYSRCLSEVMMDVSEMDPSRLVNE
jgi:creatinine amidohydrolase